VGLRSGDQGAFGITHCDKQREQASTPGTVNAFNIEHLISPTTNSQMFPDSELAWHGNHAKILADFIK
jgi:hypothetical protein